MRSLALACLVPCVAAPGQNLFVVPAQQAARSGNTFVGSLTPGFSQQPAHVQCLWDLSQVPIPVGLFYGMDLRRTQYGPLRQARNPSAMWDIQLTMATSPFGAVSATTLFVGNLNPDAAVVFQGFVSLPPGTETQVPAPFTVSIPFTTPFLYAPATGARGLVADFQVRSYQPTPTGFWLVDGQMALNATTSCCLGGNLCRLGNGNWSNGYSSATPMAPGYPLWVEYPNLLANAPGAVAFGTIGPGGNWAGATLPFDLSAAGAPGCSWYTSVMLWLPAVCSAAGALRSPSFVVPNNQLLADTGPYYHQGLVVDAGANSLGAVATVAAWFWMGNQTQPPGTTISQMNDTGGSPTGSILRQALVAQFRY